MTRKDYIKIAEVLKDNDYLWMGIHSGKTSREYRDRLALVFATVLETDNPRFDREKFIKYITS